jgi:hypothetical protein
MEEGWYILLYICYIELYICWLSRVLCEWRCDWSIHGRSIDRGINMGSHEPEPEIGCIDRVGANLESLSGWIADATYMDTR